MSCNLPYDTIVDNINNLLPNLAKEVNMTINEEPELWSELLGVTDHPFQSGTSGNKISYHGYQTPNPFTHTYHKLNGGNIPASDHNPKSNACGYNSQRILGDGMDMRGYDLEQLVLESPDFCIDNYYYANYADTFLKGKMASLGSYTKAVLNNYSFEKIYRIAQKGYVAQDGKIKMLGIGEDFADITDLNDVGGTFISRMTGGIMKTIYDYMVSADAVPVGRLNGNEAFLYIGDASDTSDWQEAEWKGDFTANSLPNLVEFIERYNITDNYRSIFMITKSSKMPRAKINAAGQVELVWRKQNDMQAQVGVMRGPNPEFNSAPYTLSFFVSKGIGDIVIPAGNEVSIDAFKPRQMDLQWRLWRDPLCKLGNMLSFIAEDVRGFLPGENPVVYLILSLRKDTAYNAADFGPLTCLTAPVTCTAPSPEGCPCPVLSNMCEGLTPNSAFFDLSPADPTLTGTVSIKTAAGTQVSATVTAVNTAGTRVQLNFGTGVIPAVIQNFYLSLVCVPFGACESDVLFSDNCSAGDAEVIVTTIDKLIPLTDADLLTATFCDGFTASVAYEATGSNLALNQYVLVGTGDDDLETLVCQHGNICHVCVTPTEGNGCPGCTVTDTPCVEE